jgi:hypothetical protein
LIAALVVTAVVGAGGVGEATADELAATQAAGSVVITQPTPGATVASPVTVRGLDLAPQGDTVTIQLVVAATGAVLATTTTPVERPSPEATGSFAAALIFGSLAEHTPSLVEVLPADGGQPLATVEVVVTGPLAPGPQVVISSPVPGATLGLSPTLVSGLETGGAYDGPLTVQLIAGPSGSLLGTANTQAQRPAPGQPGSWQVSLGFTRPQRTTGGQIQVLAVPPGGDQPQLYASVNVSVPGVLDGGGQVAITDPIPDVAVSSPLFVRGVASGTAVDARLVVRLRLPNTGETLASADAAFQPTDAGQPAQFFASLVFIAPASDQAGVVEVVLPAIAGLDAGETVIASVPVTVAGR